MSKVNRFAFVVVHSLFVNDNVIISKARKIALQFI